MFGRVPRLPVDIVFGNTLRDEDVVAHDTYVDSLQRDLSEAVKIAQRNTTEAQKRQARQYDKRVKGVPLTVGDNVLLANRKDRGKGKLADLWDSTVHVITWKDPSVHIYRVEDPTTKKSKVVHRNFILPVNFLPVVEPEDMSTIFSTVSEEVARDVESLGNEPLFDVESESGDSRTAVWIMHGQCPKTVSIGEAQGTLEEQPAIGLGMEQHQTTPVGEEDVASLHEGSSSRNSSRSITSESDVSGNDRSDSGTEGGVREQDTLHDPGSSRSDYSMSVTTRSGISSVTSPFGCSRCNTPEYDRILPKKNLLWRNQRLEPSETVLSGDATTTRRGRVVKPVRRLLESMSMIIREPGSVDSLSVLFEVLSTFVDA